MKQIKRAPGVVVTALGLLALALRGLMYLLAEDDRGLLRSHPLAWLLWALTACAALAAFRISGMDTGDGKRNIPVAAAHWIFALGLLLPARVDSAQVLPTLRMLEPVLRFGAAMALAAAGFSRLQGREPHFGCFGLLCVYLILRSVFFYGIWCHDPQLMDYVFALLGNISLTLFAYQSAALSAGLGKDRSRRFFGLFGCFCCLAAAPRSGCIPFYLSAAVWMTASVLWEKPEKKEQTHGNSR